MNSLRLAELVGSLSYALDLTEGQPVGHCVRCCWIGMHIGRRIGISDAEMFDVYFTLLLKDLGCSSNAARICELYLTDDIKFKRDFKWVDGSFPQVVKFGLENTALGKGLMQKIKTLLGGLKTKDEDAAALIATRCSRGADIARRMRFGEGVAKGVYNLDEHWDGGGAPMKLEGERIPLASRIALLAQVADVFHGSDGIEGARAEVGRRRGTWFDPKLVDAFLELGDEMWTTLKAPDVAEAVFASRPAQVSFDVDEDYLDEVAEAFSEVVDAKSPFTSGHSKRVALYTDLIGKELGLDNARRRWLHRGALLHDVGKLGVSNAILDKPGKLDDDEWKAVKMHAVYSEEILARIPQFRDIAFVAGAHHERLDGKGYPRGIVAEQISLETRIITAADIFDAITAERPYRGATEPQKALGIMRESVGTALDPTVFAALERVVVRLASVDDPVLYEALPRAA